MCRTCLFACAAVAVLIFSAKRGDAADRFWIDTAGGSFSSASNWAATSGGGAGASVRGAADFAIFDQSALYTVSLSGATTNLGLEVDRGTVDFDLNSGSYTVIGASSFEIGRGRQHNRQAESARRNRPRRHERRRH